MATDLSVLIQADDKASAVIDKFHQSVKSAATGVSGAVDGMMSKFNLLPGALAGLSTIAGGMAFKGVIDDTVNWQLSVKKLSETMGASLHDASAFSTAVKMIGLDQGTAETAALRLAKTMNSNEGIFDQLGVKVRNANGSYRDTISVMMEVNKKLSDMPAGLERNTLAMQIYGRGWSEIQQLLKMTPELLRQGTEEMDKLGTEVNSKGVDSAKQYKIAMNQLHEASEALKIKLGLELLPIVTNLAKEFAEGGVTAAHAFGEALSFAKDNAGPLELAMVSLAAPSVISGLTALAGRIAAINTAITAGTLGIGGWVALIGGSIAGGAMLGNWADKKIYQKTGYDYSGANKPNEDLLKHQSELERSEARLAEKLKQQGFSSFEEFDKASKSGKYVQNSSGNWQNTDALDKQRQDHNAAMLKAAQDEENRQAQLAADRLKLYKDTAKNILDVEKQNIKDRLDLNNGALNDLKKNYETQVHMLDSFKDTMKGITASWDATDKARLDASRFEDPLTRQRRIVQELQGQEADINSTWADPAKKAQDLNNLIAKYRELFQEYKDGDVVIYSQQEADRDFAAAEQRVRDEVKGVAGEMQAKEAVVVSLADKINNLETRTSSFNQRLVETDTILKALPKVTTLDVKFNIQGMQNLQQVAASMGYQNFGDYYTMGGKTYWKGGQLADEGTGFVGSFDVGTRYVPRTGLALIHKGEAIIPASQNRSGAMGTGPVTVNATVTINAPAGSNASAISNMLIDDLSRKLVPVLRKQMARSL